MFLWIFSVLLKQSESKQIVAVDPFKSGLFLWQTNFCLYGTFHFYTYII